VVSSPGRTLSAAVAAVAFGGCGIQVVPSEHHRPRRAQHPAALPEPPAAGHGEAACSGPGEGPARKRARACRRGAQRVLVARRNQAVDLGELSARVVGRAVRRALPTRARLVDPRYTFVLLRLDVVNQLDRPVRFGRPVREGRQPQVMLRVGGRWYPEYPQAERALADGFARQGRSIRPGELRTGEVAFAVPRVQGRRLVSGGNALGIVGFGETGGPLRPRTLGLIRLAGG